MRILWVSNAPWVPSGYGEQTALAVPRLEAMGHEMAVLCNWGLHGQATQWNGLPCYPCDGQLGNANVGTFAAEHQADLVFALCDAWVMQPDKWPPVAVWAPVDHRPVPLKVAHVLNHQHVQPVAMSRFGVEMMQDAELEPLYVPHMVDTQVFRPQPDIRDAIRDELGVPRDAFLAGMVAANVGNPSLPRKSFPQAFLAFARFCERRRDAWLYVHSDPQSREGLPLDALAAAAGCPPGRVRFPNQAAFHIPMPAQQIAWLYQAFDVLLMPSMGEGFGIPLLEAQACGVPVVTSDHSAMRELCAAGWLVDGDPWWDALQGAWFHMPHVDSIVRGLEAAWRAGGDQRLRGQAVRFAAAYDADTVAQDYWRPMLEQLELAGELVAA